MKVRIFDVLGSDIANKSILDLYAGAGSFALEALSRGAKEATLVDASKQGNIIMQRNVAHTGFLPQADVVKSKVEDFIQKYKDSDKTWDIIFMDPPYSYTIQKG
jgi:16S rRNA (guanine966-N2)-methyltransferase